MQAFEKLGLFYLGKVVDPKTREVTKDYLLYDARDLVTHAVCVGMTGSGKTGLCITLLEEAAIDNIPSIIIDPKGDMANLLLAFPDLRAEDFRPWVREEEAARRGIPIETLAQAEADSWRAGLAQSEQDGARIRTLKSAADFTVYTPGSSAGIPVSIADSFAAPASGTDADLLRERIHTTTSSLLGLLEIEADPLRSREHILIANILERCWLSGKNLDLAALIQWIQSPPMQRVGIFELESFYPASERFKLAMTLNNLLAAPGFSSWLEGEPLEPARILYTAQGRPRVAIFSIAHLSDAERMFFVTLLLSQVLGWMRAQPGTASLRALVYMDEVFGFCPPVAEPPSKRPLLTLLKQARAFGIGVVLATQNPIDLDYKGLSNSGTWFIGRLQTERDKDRLLEGLSGVGGSAGAAFDQRAISEMTSGLGKRIFLMHNVHEDHPVLFATRWALSYLPGPLTRDQIKNLMQARKPEALRPAAPQAAPIRTPTFAPELAQARPQLPPEIRQYFAPVEQQPAGAGQPVYHPFLFAAGTLNVINNKYGITQTLSLSHILALKQEMVSWDQAAEVTARQEDLARQAAFEASYLSLPPGAAQVKRFLSWQKAYLDFLCRRGRITLWKSDVFKLLSQPGESERDFRIRLQQQARERRDFELERLRQRYAAKMNALKTRLMRSEQRIQREQEQYGQQKAQTAISVGATLLGAFLGRKAASSSTLGRATTAARGASRLSREKEDVQRAEQERQEVLRQLNALEEEVRREANRIAQSYDPQQEALQPIIVRPSKADILVQAFGLLWIPYWHDPAGQTEPLFRMTSDE